MKVAVFSTKSYDKEYFRKFVDPNEHQLTFFKTSLDEKTVQLCADHEAICVFVNDDLSAPVIRALKEKGVRLIALRCAGFNNVDLEEAESSGIKVARVPAYSPMAVAEHAVALILTLNRKTHKAYNRVREYNFSLERLTGFDLHGKTVGVIGTGKIGAAFSNIMLGFGCKVIAFDKFPSEELKNKGIVYHELDHLLSKSDIISLHCPLNPETHHLIDKVAFSKMKKGVMLINTSRGALVKTKHAVRALKKGRLGYFGIDVYEQEEELFFKDLSERVLQDDLISRLISFHNVLITSHQGFLTQEALEEIATTTLKNISAFEAGNELKNEVSMS